MKRIFLLLSFTATLASGHLFGQTNTFPSSGNVGIGTTAPSYPLHLSASLGLRARFQFGTSSIDFPAYGAGSEDFSNSSGIFVSGSDGLFMTAIGKNMRFVTNNGSYLERMRVTSEGNVGIGTTNPLAKLDVRGHLLLKNPDNLRSAIFLTDSNLDEERFLTVLNSSSHAAAGGLKIGGLLISDSYAYADPLKNDAVIKGRLAIGTPNQTSDQLSVNGTIRAKEIKLEATNWPDYVFENGYGLMPLQEVKAHIDQKGHLPGLKSAREYKEEGVGMLELNQKLLEKVEELTLYILQQAKEIEAIKSKLDL